MTAYDQLALLLAPPKVAMKILTRCTSVEQFIATYHRFCAPSSCFIPSTDVRKVGSEAAFSLRLADGTPILRGICLVLDSWESPANPFGRPGMHIAITRLTPDSRLMYERLLDAASTALAAIPSSLAPADTIRVEAPPEHVPHVLAVPAAPTAAPDEITTPVEVAPPECEMREDEDSDAIPSEAELEEPTTRIAMSNTRHDRDAIATLLGMAPLQRARIPSGNALPVRVRTGATRPLVAATRLPAMTKVVRGRRSDEGMQPLQLTRTTLRIATALSRDERWWIIGAVGLTILTVIILLASSYSSMR